MTPNSISEHVFFKIFLGGHAPDPLALKYLIKNTPGVKKGRPRTKTGLAEKDVKSNGQLMPPGLIA